MLFGSSRTYLCMLHTSLFCGCSCIQKSIPKDCNVVGVRLQIMKMITARLRRTRLIDQCSTQHLLSSLAILFQLLRETRDVSRYKCADLAAYLKIHSHFVRALSDVYNNSCAHTKNKLLDLVRAGEMFALPERSQLGLSAILQHLWFTQHEIFIDRACNRIIPLDKSLWNFMFVAQLAHFRHVRMKRNLEANFVNIPFIKYGIRQSTLAVPFYDRNIVCRK